MSPHSLLQTGCRLLGSNLAGQGEERHNPELSTHGNETEQGMISVNFPLPDRAGDRRHWGNAIDSASAWAVANIAEQHQGLTLVITANSEQADQLYDELPFFLGPQTDSAALEVLYFPDWETLPYDTFSPHRDIISQRLKTLNRLPRVQHGILIIPASTLLQRLPPPGWLRGSSLVLKKGDKLERESYRNSLQTAGYTHVTTVMTHGEYTVRGSLIDLFPMGSELPYRIELFDDQVDTLRTFDPDSQRTLAHVESIELLPAHEFPFDRAAREQFQQRYREAFDVDWQVCPMYQDVRHAIAPAGIEYFLPLFFEQTAHLFDYLPQHVMVVQPSDLGATTTPLLADIKERYNTLGVNPERPLLAPDTVFLKEDELFGLLRHYPSVHLHEALQNSDRQGRLNLPIKALPDVALQARKAEPLHNLKDFLAGGDRILLTAESPGRRESLRELLAAAAIQPVVVGGWSDFLQHNAPVAITVAPLDRALWLQEQQVCLITETQLLGRRVMQRRRRRKKESAAGSEDLIKNLGELREGVHVVHQEHGIGLYRGLQVLSVGGHPHEFLQLEYAEQALLYVPVQMLHLIARYSGAQDSQIALNRLGSPQWQKSRRKAAEQARDSAAQLLDIYARRETVQGYAFPDPGMEYESFAQAFPFEETPDQLSAIAAVMADMQRPRPMDRLICGDVGFGKTEVAMRAAFIAINAGRQVGIMVPTTLLAQQHFDSFRDRFADWPVTVEMLSRFRSAKQLADIKKAIQEGRVDIVIGTHKLLQTDIEFARLGLLIIDEEHRFGVQHKERLKSLRSEVDILAMTATPIPRTLNMAMSGLRDLSIIATPPAQRLSVRTFVRHSEQALLQEAITRELRRGGQVYYLHNEINTIDKRADEIARLLPEARVITGHGQMRERALESVMQDFYHKRYNVLVCTTIIETGIDIPSANTIIIERADKFGLAQLHQLRGRVGRSHHQAYAYLLTPDPRIISKDAKLRLEAVEASNELGAGFTLATHDMEIRGAGELLGEEQSGQIHKVGFSLFTEMLEQAVESIKNGQIPCIDQPVAKGAEIDLKTPMLIPDSFVADVHSRLVFYKKIADAKEAQTLKNIQVEMIDRFGLLPAPLKRLFQVSELRLQAQRFGISRIDVSRAGGRVHFNADTTVDPGTVIHLVQQQADRWQLEGPMSLKLLKGAEHVEERIELMQDFLDRLA